jgi:FMN-dependent dehydrogenase
VYSYVGGGCGDEGTQRANVDAFSWYGIVPRMLVGATERDLSVSLFGMTLPTPVFMEPIGVIGLCSQAFAAVQPLILGLSRLVDRAVRPSCAALDRGDPGPSGPRDGIAAGQVRDLRSSHWSRSPRTSPRPARTIG